MPSRAKGGTTLSFRPPEPVRPHVVLHIPGSHTLYVGPPACMRRHALKQLSRSNPGWSSYLSITQADVVSGRYEDLVADAVDELERTLTPAPTVLFVSVFCIDDFLGTDADALVARLESSWPSTRFVFERIHPVGADTKRAMSADKYANLYSFIEPVKAEMRDNGVNLIGSFAAPEPESELFDLLDSWGLGPVRQLTSCNTFDEYQDLAKSRIGLVMRFGGDAAARAMEARLGIPRFDFGACYDLARIEQRYCRLARLADAQRPVCTPWRTAAADALHTALDLVGTAPVAIDSDATLVPFSLARALLDYGFNVTHIFRSHHPLDADTLDQQYIAEHYPHVRVSVMSDARLYLGRLGETRQTPQGDSETLRTQPVIAIGSKAARIMGTDLVVDIWHDEGHTGFHGVRLLMEKIADTWQHAQTEGSR